MQSSAKSLKGRIQLPSATGAFAFLDLPAVRLSVNTCCSGLPQRPERHRSRPQAPFQNLPRSPSVPASGQHRHAASSCSQEDAPASPVSPPPAKATVLVQRMGQARGHGHPRKPGGQPKRAHLLGEHWGLHPCGGDRLAAWRRTRGEGAAEVSGSPQTRAREGLRSREKEDSTLGTSEVFTHMCKYHREGGPLPSSLHHPVKRCVVLVTQRGHSLPSQPAQPGVTSPSPPGPLLVTLSHDHPSVLPLGWS